MPRAAFRPARAALLLVLAAAVPALAGNWPQWRGPDGDGVSAETGLPLKWSEDAGVLWKYPLPGPGASTPAVWGDSIFLTTQDGDALNLVKLTTAGKEEWKRQVGAGTPDLSPPKGKNGDARRRQKFNPLHNMASPSPVTDGEVVAVHFGNGDLAAYDFAGKQLWKRNLQKEHGNYTIWWGHANSPVLYQDLVINACMQDSLADLPGDPVDSYLVACDKKTGEPKWKTLRKTKATAEECDAYTTPLLWKHGGRTELVVMGGNQLDAYDPATGRQLWYLPGLVGGRTVGGPTAADGLVYATQGKRGPLLAVRPDGDGELPDKAVVWKATKNTPDTCCPVVCKGLLFRLADDGFAHCQDAKTGEEKWLERLPGQYKASPLAADGRVYFVNLDGLCTVVAASDKFEKLASNQLDGQVTASPAVADGRIYLRSSTALYCVGSK
jgi:outer membrane protein assembly factor BamB